MLKHLVYVTWACVGLVSSSSLGSLGVEQVHVAAGETSDTAVVAFATVHAATKPFVYLNISASMSIQRVGGLCSNFTEHNPSGVQHICRVDLHGLPPRTRVYYQACVEADGLDACSKTFSFATLGSNEHWDPQLLFFGDLGHDGGELIQRWLTALPAITAEVKQGHIDAVLHMGDFAYDMHDKGGVRGDEFMRRIEPVAANVFYQTIPGNHEIIDGSFAHYRARFHMPRKDEMGGFRMWWSMNLGKIHLVALSTEVLFGRPQSEQHAMLQWLESDLAAANANRARQPWVVTLGHRPPYCSNLDKDCLVGGSDGERVRAALETVLYKGKVDVALWAHEHSYERLWPVFNYTVTQKSYLEPAAPVHIISGAAGCNEGSGLCLNPIDHAGGDWSAFHAGTFHPYSYGHLRAPNATHLYLDQVNAHTGHIFDSIWIQKHAAPVHPVEQLVV